MEHELMQSENLAYKMWRRKYEYNRVQNLLH